MLQCLKHFPTLSHHIQSYGAEARQRSCFKNVFAPAAQVPGFSVLRWLPCAHLRRHHYMPWLNGKCTEPSLLAMSGSHCIQCLLEITEPFADGKCAKLSACLASFVSRSARFSALVVNSIAINCHLPLWWIEAAKAVQDWRIPLGGPTCGEGLCLWVHIVIHHNLNNLIHRLHIFVHICT